MSGPILPSGHERSEGFHESYLPPNGILKKRGTPAEPADLSQHDCLLFSHGRLQKHWELQRARERCTVEVRGVAFANSTGLLGSFARDDQGIAILPEFLARSVAYGGGLVQVLPECEAVPAYVFAVTPMQLLPAKIRKLVDFAKVRFGQQLAALEGY